LVLGSAILPAAQEVPTLDAWFSTPFEGGRHARRLAQIVDYERTHERK
jgi:ribose 5-phosphate isomerase RpiB